MRRPARRHSDHVPGTHVIDAHHMPGLVYISTDDLLGCDRHRVHRIAGRCSSSDAGERLWVEADVEADKLGR